MIVTRRWRAAAHIGIVALLAGGWTIVLLSWQEINRAWALVAIPLLAAAVLLNGLLYPWRSRGRGRRGHHGQHRAW